MASSGIDLVSSDDEVTSTVASAGNPGSQHAVSLTINGKKTQVSIPFPVHARGTAPLSRDSWVVRPSKSTVKETYCDLMSILPEGKKVVCLALVQDGGVVRRCGTEVLLSDSYTNFIDHLERVHPLELTIDHMVQRKLLQFVRDRGTGSSSSSSSSSSKGKTQQTMLDMMPTRRLSKQTYASIFARYLLRSYSPYTTVTEPAFRDMLSELGLPVGDMPRYTTIVSAIPEQFEALRRTALEPLKEHAAPSVSVVIDGGNRRNQHHPMIAVSVVSMSETGAIVNRAVACNPFRFPHDAATYAEARDDALSSLGEGWVDRALFSVHDGAAVMFSMTDPTRQFDVLCVVHTLNNAVKDVVSGNSVLQSALDSARVIVNGLMGRPKFMQAFMSWQLDMITKKEFKTFSNPVVFVRDVETRFFSSIAMLERVYDLLPVLRAKTTELHTLFKDEGEYPEFCAVNNAMNSLYEHDISFGRALLVRASEWSVLLSGHSYVTFDMVIPMARDLERECLHVLDLYNQRHGPGSGGGAGGHVGGPTGGGAGGHVGGPTVDDRKIAMDLLFTLGRRLTKDTFSINSEIYITANILGVRALQLISADQCRPEEEGDPQPPVKRPRGRPPKPLLPSQKPTATMPGPFLKDVSPERAQNCVLACYRFCVYARRHPYPQTVPPKPPRASVSASETVAAATSDDAAAKGTLDQGRGALLSVLKKAAASAAAPPSATSRPATTLKEAQQRWESAWLTFSTTVLVPEWSRFLDAAAERLGMDDNQTHFRMDPYTLFWGANKGQLPHLWALSRVLLAIPASTIGVEAMFSVMGNVDRPRRASLSNARLGQLTLTNLWKKQVILDAAEQSRKISWPLPGQAIAGTALFRVSEDVSEVIQSGADAVKEDEVATLDSLKFGDYIEPDESGPQHSEEDDDDNDDNDDDDDDESSEETERTAGAAGGGDRPAPIRLSAQRMDRIPLLSSSSSASFSASSSASSSSASNAGPLERLAGKKRKNT